ncbi:Asp-tRNAAsn/Glu-tRNAGln amidotransferase C subunit [Candidatus Vampirococcus lugosii]|uniref:Asp-tRNAAsn/Glu-tRNAGln amidotransferase C subunit n=2 Tax=Candidatus Vampirococcus lugosii TaxID=2789015 RepID=A0ABS5QJP7_9BACT|nr:Asp-tRNAAsn/Glu-tRNAGln amidotransferase C subunit [Candidatus Vampirococcus lugosii]
MGLTVKDLDHISKLCSLNINESEKDKFISQIEDILGFVSKLQNLDIDSVESLSHPIENNYMEMNTGLEKSNFSDGFIKNINHNIKDNGIVIKSAIK